ncbi:MAG: DUF475 domain-containing protein [Pseudomonadales bacterium]
MVTLAGLIAGYFIGGPAAVFIVAVLAVLEISLSFDNAVVNATVLKEMDEVWRKRFLTWGILIAVFGMRIVFPVLIVSVLAGVSPWAALQIAINQPEEYAARMIEAHVSLMAFGGAFLMMVGLKFFFDDDKDHWIPFIEKPLALFEKFSYSAEVFTIGFIAVVAFFFLSGADTNAFLVSGAMGVATFMVIHAPCC